MAVGIIIKLDEHQQEALRPVMDKIREMEADGKPGMAVAQLHPDHISCGWLSHERARLVQDLLGNSGDTTRSAYDRS